MDLKKEMPEYETPEVETVDAEELLSDIEFVGFTF